MNKLLNEYRNKFNEQFPLMLVMSMEEKEIEAIIKKCINEGKAYNPKLKENAVY